MSAKKKRLKESIMFEEIYKLENIIITDHAVERFTERSKKLKLSLDSHDKIRSQIMNILNKSSKENVGAYNVFRLINNNFKDANYFISDGWRFVLCENTVVTIERRKKEEN